MYSYYIIDKIDRRTGVSFKFLKYVLDKGSRNNLDGLKTKLRKYLKLTYVILKYNW